MKSLGFSKIKALFILIPYAMKSYLRFLLLTMLLLNCTRSFVYAQTLHSIDIHSDYHYRLLQISGKSQDNISFTVRPVEPEPALVNEHPWGQFVRYTSNPNWKLGTFKSSFFEPTFTNTYNTTLPRGLNDGVLWQGRGYNTALSTGIYTSYGILHLKLKPVVGYTQNAQFDLGRYPESNGSPYNYRIRPQIDLVQRFGNKSYTWSDLGDSFIALRYRGWNAGVSNQRIWSGPTTTYPLLFSYQGPGFIHATVGSYRPLHTPIGNFEFNYFYGGLKKSEYFQNRLGNRLTSMHALILAYSPSFVKGFTIGGQRLYMETFPTEMSDLNRHLSKMFNPFVRDGLKPDETGSTWDPDNQMAAMFFRWVFPKDAFEIYGEYGRNDHNQNLRDFRMQPDHVRAFTFGVIKTYETRNEGLIGVNLEMIQTESTRNAFTRGLGNLPTSPNQLGLLGSWYTHIMQTVGFTNKGQMIGSGFGPGGNAQLFQMDYFYPQGKWGVSLTRIEYHNTLIDNTSITRNYYELIMSQNPEDTQRWELRNTEFVLAVDHTRMMKYGVEMAVAVDLSRILNHQYVRGNDLWNLRMELVLRKRLKGGLR